VIHALAALPRRLVKHVLNRYAPPDVLIGLRYLRRESPAFPPRNVAVTNHVPAAAVLVLAPHPDDEVIGMGGTLHMHVTNGSSVTVLYMTDGAGLGEARAETVAQRRREAESVGRACAIRQIFWNKPDTGLTNDQETVAEMASLIATLRPSLIYLPSYFDRHYDHFSANALLADALRRLPAVDVSVLGYEVWDNVPFQNLLVDISDHMEAKKTLMRNYQTPLRATDFVRLVECRGATHYLLYIDSRLEQGAKGYAEAFSRFSAESYVTLFDSYVRVLREHHSPVLSHLQR